MIATLSLSVLALLAIFTLGFKEKLLQKMLLFLVALSAGSMIGGAFLHLIPEALAEQGGNIKIFIFVLIGFSIFFLVEKVLHWHHCHKPHHHKKTGKKANKVESFAIMNLVGDGIHNFIDGLIIAVAFVADTGLGITTTIAVALHEIPQEISDFGVLVYGGYNKSKALLLNFVTAAMAVLGGILGYLLSNHIEKALGFLLPIAAGGFIYIAASDLIPELKKEEDLAKSTLHFSIFILGILLMYGLLLI